MPDRPRTPSQSPVILDERQKRMMRATAPLLRVVALLRPRLLVLVTHHDGRGHGQGQLLRDAVVQQRPALLNHSPQQVVQKRNHALTCPPEPAPERRGVRHTGPAEDPALEQGQVIDYSTTVEQQRDPHLGHQARPVEPLLLVRPAVDPAGQAEPAEQLSNQHQSAGVGEILCAVPDAQRPSRALHTGLNSRIMMPHRPGGLRFEEGTGVTASHIRR